MGLSHAKTSSGHVAWEEQQEVTAGVSKEVESEILRLFYAEKWKRWTIARQLQIHRGVVGRVLTRTGIDVERVRIRRSLIEPYLPFVRSVLQKCPRLTGSRLYAMVKERTTCCNGRQLPLTTVTLHTMTIMRSFTLWSLPPGCPCDGGPGRDLVWTLP